MADSVAAFEATFARKSLISKGPSFSYFLSVRASSVSVSTSMDSSSLSLDRERGWASRQQHDQSHAPDCQQRVADGVGHRVAKGRYLALGLIAHQSKRRRGGAGAGDDAERERIVETKQVLGHEHPEHQWDGGGEGAPHEQTGALRLQAIDESRTGGDADD